MSNELFNVDTAQLEALAKFYKRAPKVFAKASASMLNEFAFGTRASAFNEIASKMTIRNPGFVKSRMQVSKASKSAPIQNQISVMGSMATARFSGWKEQQLGTPTARKKTISLLARLGSKKRQAAPKARLKPGDILDYNDIRVKGDSSPYRRTIAMMRMLARAHSNTPFIISRASGMTPGLYRMQRGKAKILQRFEMQQPKRIPWLTNARDRYFATTSIDRLWVRTLDYALRGERVGR